MYKLLRVQFDSHSLIMAPTETDKDDHIYGFIHI